MRSVAAFAISISATLGALADTAGAPPAMTLSEALAHARVHQPSLVAARARLEAAELEDRIPGGLWFPRVGFTAQELEGPANNTTASYLGTPAVDLPRIGSTKAVSPAQAEWNPHPSILAAVGLRQEVFDFGRIAALEGVADANLAADRGHYDADRLDLELLVIEGFLAVRGAHGVLGASESAFARATVNRDTAAAGVRSGLRRPIDLTRAEADLARSEVVRIRALGALTSAQAVFAASVGLEARGLDAKGEPEPPLPMPSLDAAIESALAKDPSVREADARLQLQSARTRVARAELRPELLFSSTLSGRAGGAPPSNGPVGGESGWVPSMPNWDAALVLSWPIFDMTSLRRAGASRAAEEARRAEVEAIRLRLSTDVQQVYTATLVAQEALPALERSAEAARQNGAQAEARFKAGLATSLELADAEELQTEAEIGLAIGHFEAARARARLSRTIGEGL